MKNNKEVQEHRYLQDTEYFEGLDKRTKESKDYQKWKANYDAAPSGLGDVVEKAIPGSIKKAVKKVFGDDCGCNERKQKLNTLVKLKPQNCFTEEQYKQWTEFRNRTRKNEISVTEQQLIQQILKDVYNLSVTIKCSQCNAKKYVHWINQIDKFYETY